ncbi:hypothetical protein DPMN_147340 [Dreissena polymorpha]|uniref:Uncharacterized protein n=1 Tax=Dreissena polymorpha TaxID=45954 RepID=A0A9D4J2X0_DREPO|nr:hypothetical protein DPMN_147340 [Dreissena polymorpha]
MSCQIFQRDIGPQPSAWWFYIRSKCHSAQRQGQHLSAVVAQLVEKLLMKRIEKTQHDFDAIDYKTGFIKKTAKRDHTCYNRLATIVANVEAASELVIWTLSKLSTKSESTG